MPLRRPQRQQDPVLARHTRARGRVQGAERNIAAAADELKDYLSLDGVYVVEDADIGPDGAAQLCDVIACLWPLRTLAVISSTNRHHASVIATRWP